MTRKQKACLEAIKRLTVDGVPPDYDTLRKELGLASKSGVHRLLHALRDRGVVEFRPGHARSIRLVADDAEGVPFTALASAALGHFQNHEGRVSEATMRAELVRAFRAYRVQFPQTGAAA